MRSKIQELLVIQDHDKRMAQLIEQQKRIPLEIASTDDQIRQETSHLDSQRQELKHLEANRKKLEIDVEARQQQAGKYKTQLFQIKSNTEYQALLKEIANIERAINEIEDHELDCMEQLEGKELLLKEQQAKLAEITAKAETNKQHLQKRIKLIEQELAQHQSERENLAQQTDAAGLNRYDRLMRSKGDVAIVAIQNGNFRGCHLQLAPHLIHSVKQGLDLTVCDYCGRILYWQPD